ncbi:MAG TPA: hypothetical protein VFP20_11360 [Bacteroidales bacterium]|nr:hypothetical protein [Bacteroidales bacterium]
MRKLTLLLLICLSTTTFGQKIIKGSITFRSSQNIYVMFENTEGIQVGDTLFSEVKGWLVPVLLVKSFSSTSCLCVALSKLKMDETAFIQAKIPVVEEALPVHQTADELEATKSVNADAIGAVLQGKKVKKLQPQFDGRLSLTSYSNLTGVNSNQRFRYNLSFNAQNIDSSAFSAESYLSFSHRLGEWKGITDALKVYSLAVNYHSGNHAVTLGRKINLNMANIGAVDGLQYEYTRKALTFGLMGGSRPDYYTYGLNPDLLQFGAFVSHHVQMDKGDMQTSLALFNQMNQFKTDRRFAYLQHSNALLKNLNVFASAEVDFYTLVNLQPTSTFDLTSAYVSLRYKPFSNLSLSLSYDARKNIYYYETFKNQIDSIIDRETRQGLRFNFNYRPFKKIVWGGNAGYRSKKSDRTPSVNANTYLSYMELPWINAYGTLDLTYLKTSYLNGMVYGASLSKELFDGKVYGELKYRLVNYDYTNSSSTLRQNIAECSLSWRMAKKLMLSVDFEGTMESIGNSARVYLNLTRRF